MVKIILNLFRKASQLAKSGLKAAIQGSGTGALYLGASTLLAGILLAAYLTYAWDITPTKWYRALAILQGYELDEIQKAEQAGAAEVRYEGVRAYRGERLLDDDYNRDVTQQIASFSPPPKDPEPTPPPPQPSSAERISAYEKRIADDLAKAQSSGLDEQTRLLENADPEWAKTVLLQDWKDGKYQRVLTILLDMADRRRGAIFYAMQPDNEEELKAIGEMLQRIGDGEPMSAVIKDAAKEP